MEPGLLGTYPIALEPGAIATWREIVEDPNDRGVPMSFVLTWMLHALRLALGGIPAGGVLARHELRFEREPPPDAVVDTEVRVKSLYEKRGRPYVAVGLASILEANAIAVDVMHLIWPRAEGSSQSAGRPIGGEGIDGERLVEGLISQQQIDRYAALTGDYNPLHVDPAAGAASSFRSTIAHGPIPLGYLFRALEAVHARSWVPGLSLDARFVGPARPGDRLAALRIGPGEFGVVRADGQLVVVGHAGPEGDER